MGRITDIAKQKRNKTRVSIFIDDEFVCGLDAVTVASARIKIGDELTADELKALVAKSEENCAFERAVGYLSDAPRAKREIQTYLRGKGYDRDVIARVMEKLDAYRYIDDEAYARSYIKSKYKRYGSFRITAELKKKGISDSVIEELLSEFECEEDGAISAARKYVKSHADVQVPKLKRFLAGRGFSWDSISAAVSTLADEGAFECVDEDFD